MWGLRKQIDDLREELAVEKRSKGQAVRTIKRLGRENKRLRDAIEGAIGACTCRAIEPCEGCELLKSVSLGGGGAEPTEPPEGAEEV